MNTTLWEARDEDGNECSLLRDPDGNIIWSMDGGLYFSGYPSIKLNREQMEGAILAMMIEVTDKKMEDLMHGDSNDNPTRSPGDGSPEAQ